MSTMRSDPIQMAILQDQQLLQELHELACRMYGSDNSFFALLAAKTCVNSIANRIRKADMAQELDMVTMANLVEAVDSRMSKITAGVVTGSQALETAGEYLNNRSLFRTLFFPRHALRALQEAQYQDAVSEIKLVEKCRYYFDAYKQLRYTDPGTTAALQAIIDSVRDPYPDNEFQ